MDDTLGEVIQRFRETDDCQLKFRLLIIKLYLQDHTGTEIAEILEISKSSVYYWINRYQEQGITGLSGKKREGRPRKLDYERLKEDLLKSPIHSGFNSNNWTIDIINRHILNSQGVNISSSHTYAILSELGLSIKCNGINCMKSRDLKTLGGDVITPLHLETMAEASIMLDAPIARIITSRGIKPELKIVSRSKDKIMLKGKTETGELTLTFEEFH